MPRIRLRSKLVLSLICTTAILTGASLFIVQNYLRAHAREEIFKQIPDSLETFRQFAQQRQKLFLQSAAVSADLPIIRALMTTQHAETIQDVSADFWQLAESDLFLLANPGGRIMAFHSNGGGFSKEAADAAMAETLRQRHSRDWWSEDGRLYEIFLKPIYSGAPEDNVLLGFLVAGFAIDDRFATTVARITSSDIAVRYGKTVVASSLSASRRQELAVQEAAPAGSDSNVPAEITLGGERFVGASAVLTPLTTQPVRLTVLKSYDAATLFLKNVNRLLLGIGFVALIAGSILMFLISHTLTRPLDKLVSGVVAMEKGDFSYPLRYQSRDEVGDLTLAFDAMRKTLRESQQNLLHAERLATIGQMASTISHDLRHPLTSILAYAELLSETSLDDARRLDMYRQIRLSVNNMTDLIASLLEFSKAQEALRLVYTDCVDTLQDTIRGVRLRPEFKTIEVSLLHEGPTQGWFDPAKLGRVFSNLLRNACEAAPPDSGRIRVVVRGSESQVEISISDNGAGIPEEIRSELFQPFVTFGKPDGNGLGLAVVQKIVADHGGQVVVASTGKQGTTFKMTLPVVPAPGPALLTSKS